MDVQGNIERTWKVREKSGNFEVDGKWQPWYWTTKSFDKIVCFERELAPLGANSIH